jgi:hypothetical protein
MPGDGPTNHQSSLAAKAGITVAAARGLSGADLTQAALLAQAGATIGDKRGTTELLKAVPTFTAT